MNKNFYFDLISNIEYKISEKKYSSALSLINEELNMPYIPMSVEKKLISFKKNIEREIIKSKNSLISIDEIVNLLRNESIDILDRYEILNLLEKFNLKNEEIFKLLKDKNVDFLIKLKILSFFKKQTNFKNIEVNFDNKICLVNSDDLFDVDNNKNFAKDSKKIEDFIFKFPNLLEFSLNVLEKYYFVEFFKNKDIGNVWKEVIFITAKLYENKNLQNKIISILDFNINDFEKKVIKILNLTKY